MAVLISNKKISPLFFCIFAIAINLVALTIYNQIKFNPTNIHDISSIKLLFLISIGGQSVLISTLVRLLFFFNNNYESMQKLNFFEILRVNKTQGILLLYILSTVFLISYIGLLINVNLLISGLLTVIFLIGNLYFFYFANKRFKPIKSSNIMALNGLILIFSSSTITLFSFSKLILLYYPLGGLIFSFLLK